MPSRATATGTPQSRAASTARVVDFHNHMVTEAVVAFLVAEGDHLATRVVEGPGGRTAHIGDTGGTRLLGPRMCDPAARLADMDRLGITTQAVSATPFLLYPDAPPEVALAVARVNNDSLAEIARRHPGRFVPLASVPLQDPQRAAAELERAVGIGLRGVEIPPATPELALDDRRLEPFWSAAEARRVPICIHPFEASPQGPFARYLLSPLVGNLHATGIAAALLVMGGVLERHPALRIVLYHAGGTFPALLARLDKGHELFDACRERAPKRPSAYSAQLWFDTVAFDPRWLLHLVQRFGADHLVLGSDYPLPLGPSDPVGDVRALALGPADEQRILGGNACRLLDIDGAREVLP
ncbi:MAG: amidohydrolase [Deltaproteobacteria bacterium]|nr:amidohydrolase [Deltaproteobacteria bacterium]